MAERPAIEVANRTVAKMNRCMLFSNVLVVVLTVTAGVLTIEQFDRAEATFLEASKILPESLPNPCAISTPDIYYLFQGLGLADTSIMHTVARSTWMERTEHALCHASYSGVDVGTTAPAYDYAKRAQTLAALLRNKHLRPPASFQTYLNTQNTASGGTSTIGDHLWARQSEKNVVEALCNISHDDHGDNLNGEFNSKLYGDMVERVSRAYLNAMPAFYKLATSGTHPEPLQRAAPFNWERSCMEDKHPFADGVVSTNECPWVETIRRELAAAGTTAQSALVVGHHTTAARSDDAAQLSDGATVDNPEQDIGGFYKESMPRVDAMLYRLLALTVVAHYDRKHNQGACFTFPESGGISAGEMCKDIYAAAGATNALNTPAVTISDFPSARFPTMDNIVNYDIDSSTQVSYMRKNNLNAHFQSRMAAMIPLAHRQDPETAGMANTFEDYEYEPNAAGDPRVYGGDARPQARTCHMGEKDHLDFSPPPPAPDWDFRISPPPPGTGALPPSPSMPWGESHVSLKDAVVGACTENMQWGLFDQARLFGLPDTVQPFVLDPRDPTGYAFKWVWETFENDYYTNVVEDKEKENDAVLQLRYYTGFQIAAIGLWTTLFASVLGFFASFAATPLLVMILYRLPGGCNLKTANGVVPMTVRPTLVKDYVFIVVSLFGLFVWFWLAFVSPTAPPHYPISAECAEFHGSSARAHGGSFVTSSVDETESILINKRAPGSILLFLVIWAWFYELVLANCYAYFEAAYNTVKEFTMTAGKYDRYNAGATATAILLAAGCIGAAVGSAVIQGNYWKDVADESSAKVEEAEAEWLSIEVRMVPITAFLQAVGVGVMSQRYVYRRLPIEVMFFFYVLAGALFVLPFWVRYVLMLDGNHWATLFAGDKRTDQEALFYIGLVFGLIATSLVILAMLFMCQQKKAVQAETGTEKTAELTATEEGAKEAADGQALAEDLAKNAKEQRNEKDRERVRESTTRRAEKQLRAKWYRWSGQDLLDRVKNEEASSSANAGGAYLPMIRITV